MPTRDSVVALRAKLDAVTKERDEARAERDEALKHPNVCQKLDLILDAVRQKERAEKAEADLEKSNALIVEFTKTNALSDERALTEYGRALLKGTSDV
jgi:hypothetical protein